MQQMKTLRQIRPLAAAALLVTGLVTGIAQAQPSLYEVEPNNTPAEATETLGEVVLIGTMEGQASM